MPGVDVLRTKSVEQSLKDTEDPEFKLKRSLTALDLTVFGVGVIIGARSRRFRESILRDAGPAPPSSIAQPGPLACARPCSAGST